MLMHVLNSLIMAEEYMSVETIFLSENCSPQLLKVCVNRHDFLEDIVMVAGYCLYDFEFIVTKKALIHAYAWLVAYISTHM